MGAPRDDIGVKGGHDESWLSPEYWDPNCTAGTGSGVRSVQ